MSFSTKIREIEEMERKDKFIEPDKCDPKAYKHFLWQRTPDGPAPTVDKRHGGPYDRGGADSYYQRRFSPHYYVAGTYDTPRIEVESMTSDQIDQYAKGFADNEEAGDFKVY